MRLSLLALLVATISSSVAAFPKQQSWARRETRAEAGKRRHHIHDVRLLKKNSDIAAANVRRLMQEETMGSIATVFPEETDYAGMYDLLGLSIH